MSRRRYRILIVDDEPNSRLSLQLILEGEGHAVFAVGSAAEFRANYRAGLTDLFLIDVKLPDASGIELLRTIRQTGDSAPVVIVSGHGTVRDAVDATRSGAFDFLEKPLARDRVLVAVRNALDQADLRRENERFRDLLGDAPQLIGQSDALRRVIADSTRVARTDASVLLTGESGTGKELLAAHVHRESARGSGPFIKVNCAAIPADLIESELFGHEKGAFTGAATARRGRFEMADAGTIFLDEVGDLHAASQAKLLRVLQDGECQRLGSEQPIRVAVRVIAATNRPLPAMIADGRFRQDLYYRLNVVPIRIPPLRERREDIGELVSHFLDDFCSRNNLRPKTVDAGVVATLMDYDWPGNVRELRNIVERMAILTPGDAIGNEAVPMEIRSPATTTATGLHAVRNAAERDRIREALEESGGNVSAAARRLGVERTNLHKRMRALGVRRDGL